ncbi:EAL domain-containing protein [Halopseudomonas nanhaiensis]|uniref:putative bifunctional diguanylate cyclase/phosphodiesterase n=1 Tax=Halopseudomonas nanhaiensis TaxID=2830842 RepID=UPI001CBDD993|nr:EAL domain-containing protein [Halopseudomonas nanhaiensis]UAW99633.1 EAL domain-containing protein [Halopseudomonas nanhaiensis]
MSSHDTRDEGFIALFRRLPVACMLTQTSDSTVLAVNPAFEQLFGWRAADVIRRHSTDLPIWSSPNQRESFLGQLQMVGHVQQSETVFRCSDGSLKPCLVYVEFIDVAGRACRLSMALDISDRAASEQALKRSETKFSALFQDSPEPYLLFERRSARITQINRSFSEVFGYTPDDVVGKTAMEIGLWQYPDKRPAVIAKLLRDKRLRNEPVDMIAKDGRAVSCEVASNFVPIGDELCVLTTLKDVTERRRVEARIKHQAYHDGLTDLPNRQLLNDRIQQHIALGERHGLSCALLFFDLDHFKRINDSLGHALGDAVLREVGSRLLQLVRKADTVSRLGGDEFVVLLTGLEGSEEDVAREIRLQATKLLNALAAPMSIRGHTLQLGCSIGVAMAPLHGNTAEELLKHADTALYGVKASGRNSIAFFEPHMQLAVSQRLLMEAELRQALLEQQFCLVYQPQVDGRTQRIVGAEALLRWRHPQKGLVSPNAFMHVLEDSGMILQVGHWVLRHACRFTAGLLAQGRVRADQFSLSINVSPRQFRQPEFVDRVAAALAECAIPPSCLYLEITEGMVMQDVGDTVAKMDLLRDMGIRFAIDDFGTGYSSLSYLKRLPVDLLKIDQSFVRDCASDCSDAEIVRAIIAMARSLKLNLIAEGVETPEQLAFLQNEGCHDYQGYLFSRPLADDAFCDLLATFKLPATPA